jgi:chemotaxis family two-component system response regulator Rcp1
VGDDASCPPDVLIVDDNRGFLRVIRAVLGEGTPSFRTHTVETGQAALAFLRHEERFVDVPRPDFVVLDFHLPDMDAPEVLLRIRERGDLTEIPVLVLSQADWAEDARAALEAGGRRFRAKPSDLDELQRIIVDFWRDTRTGGASKPPG